MRKAKGGEARGEETSGVMQEDKDNLSKYTDNVQKTSGLPISVYVKGKYDPDASKEIMDSNFYEKLKENREDTGKELNREEELSFKWPGDEYDYNDKAQGYSARSLAMKKSKGGMAKGGNWIKNAIKKPGALHRELGVPMGKKIPAAKLEKATHASGKLGQRARMAKTLKGMK